MIDHRYINFPPAMQANRVLKETTAAECGAQLLNSRMLCIELATQTVL